MNGWGSANVLSHFERDRPADPSRRSASHGVATALAAPPIATNGSRTITVPTARVIRPKGYVTPAASVGRMPSDDCPGRGSDEVAVGSTIGTGRSRTFDAFPG